MTITAYITRHDPPRCDKTGTVRLDDRLVAVTCGLPVHQTGVHLDPVLAKQWAQVPAGGIR